MAEPKAKTKKPKRIFPDKGGSYIRQGDGSVAPAPKPAEEKPAAKAPSADATAKSK